MFFNFTLMRPMSFAFYSNIFHSPANRLDLNFRSLDVGVAVH